MQYKTISKRTESLFKDRGSKFCGYLYPVRQEDEVKMRLEELQHLHPRARHVCYAYRIGGKGQKRRVNDDGEPSGSAGLPIYNQLLSHDLTNVLAAVVRYFGGTKLGIPGLINAYKESISMAIGANEILESSLKSTYIFTADYKFHPFLMDAISKNGVRLKNENYSSIVKLTVELEQSKEDLIIERILASTLQVPTTQLDPEVLPAGLDFELLEREE